MYDEFVSNVLKKMCIWEKWNLTKPLKNGTIVHEGDSPDIGLVIKTIVETIRYYF